ncbi:hypothetical protein G7046_g38 [Stylonectria norvegica]|nr:hypothetical protein G7046_g38 [Stylonectria norvegica]
MHFTDFNREHTSGTLLSFHHGSPESSTDSLEQRDSRMNGGETTITNMRMVNNTSLCCFRSDEKHYEYLYSQSPLVRSLQLTPPFLVEDYVPQYLTLRSRDATKKRFLAYAYLSTCMEPLSARMRPSISAKVRPHVSLAFMIATERGPVSRTLHPATLRQRNSFHPNGRDLTTEELGDWYITLHLDSLQFLQLMDRLVVYLAIFKVWETSISKRLLKADGYAATARESVKAMQAEVGDLCFTADGIAKMGVLVRHLVMPGKEAEGAEIMRFLAKEVSTDFFVNLMEQYHPDAHVPIKKREKRYLTSRTRRHVPTSIGLSPVTRSPQFARPSWMQESGASPIRQSTLGLFHGH